MSSTPNLSLPLLMPSQAQKHVTVNEALSKLDALVKLTVLAADVSVPPTTNTDGDAYIIGTTADGDWTGRDAQIAFWANDQWMYFQPRSGWQAWDKSGFSLMTYDGFSWSSGILCCTPSGSATVSRVIEFEHVITPGWNNLTSVPMPNNSVVIGVTGRVISKIVGEGITSWRLGTEGQNQQFGTDLGIDLNSHVHGVLSYPTAYYTPTALRLGAITGAFLSGKVRLSIHLLELSVPREV